MDDRSAELRRRFLFHAAVQLVLALALGIPAGVGAPHARQWLAGAGLYQGGAGDPYRYSPLVTVLFVPFSQLPDRVGGVLWRRLLALMTA